MPAEQSIFQHSERIPYAEPVPNTRTWQFVEVDITDSVKKLNDPGPYPGFANSSVKKRGRSLGSSPNHRRDHHKDKARRDARQSTRDITETPTCPSVLPNSHIPPTPSKPEEGTLTQYRTESNKIGVGDLGTEPQAVSLSPEPRYTAKRRTAPIPPSPEYSLFPKQSYRQSQSQSYNRQPIPPNPAHSESVRRSLPQQRQLSALPLPRIKIAAPNSLHQTRDACRLGHRHQRIKKTVLLKPRLDSGPCHRSN